MDLLKKVVEKLSGIDFLLDNKWKNAECTFLSVQLIHNCNNNRNDYGDAFIWYTVALNRLSGIHCLLEDGSIVQEDYQGTLPHPELVCFVNNKPQILRVTESMLKYVLRIIPKNKKISGE